MQAKRSTRLQRPSRHSGPPFAFVQTMLDVYARRGLDPGQALAQARIRPVASRDGRPVWPDQISATQFEQFCHAAMLELDDEAPGWFRRPLPWGSYGMLARGSQGASTLGLALQRWFRHHRLLTEDALLRLDVEGGTASVRVEERLPESAPREFALLSLLRNVHGLACWWTESRIGLQEAAFPFAAPAHVAIYQRLFPGPVAFNALQAELRFDAAYLELPLRRSQADLDRMLRRALPLMVLPYRRDRLLVERVRRLLRGNLRHTSNSLADALAMSARSLHRQLAAEGSSVQTLKDEQRQALATELLRQTRRPIKQVAHAAGFDSDKSFARAFRSWTGQSPEQYRAGRGPEP